MKKIKIYKTPIRSSCGRSNNTLLGHTITFDFSVFLTFFIVQRKIGRAESSQTTARSFNLTDLFTAFLVIHINVRTKPSSKAWLFYISDFKVRIQAANGRFFHKAWENSRATASYLCKRSILKMNIILSFKLYLNGLSISITSCPLEDTLRTKE